jgi:putative transposase
MHRELKRETTRPPANTMRKQQKLFDAFIEDYNCVRPHESLGQITPASVFNPSPHPFPEKLPQLDYPGHFETRKADHKGTISWRGEKVFLASPLAGETVGLEEFDDGVWSIYFASTIIGRFDARTGTVCG